MEALFRKYWKVLAGVLAVVVLFCSGMLTERRRHPARVEVYEKMVEHTTVQKVVDQDAVRQAVASAQKEWESHRHVVVVEKRLPDGTDEKTTTTDVDRKATEDTETQDKTEVKTHATEAATRDIVHETVRVETRQMAPTWTVALDGGASLPALLGGTPVYHPPWLPFIPGAVEVGASVDRQVLGPVFVGVRAATSGTVGVRLGVRW